VLLHSTELKSQSFSQQLRSLLTRTAILLFLTVKLLNSVVTVPEFTPSVGFGRFFEQKLQSRFEFQFLTNGSVCR